MTFPLDANTVRAYMVVDLDTTERYSNATIGSNMRTALGLLERKTHRYIGDRTQTLKFTTNGKPYVTIPGLRTASTISLVGVDLTMDETYHLIPDAQQTGLYTGIQLRGFNQNSAGPWWLSSPEWFDRNLDSPYHPTNRGWGDASIPNDLSVGDKWGYADDAVPDEAVMAVKVLTAHLTTLAQANSAGQLQTLDGNLFDLSTWPGLVQEFVREWSISPGVGS